MTRSTPDPIFTDAARAELLRMAGGAEDRAVARERRPRRVEFLAVAAVVVVAVAVLVGVQQLRPTVDRDGAAPAGTTASTSPLPTEAPSATAEPTGAAPTDAAPSPTGAPSTPVVDTTAPADTMLIGPRGAQRRTDEAIRAYAAQQGFSSIWGEQAVLDTHCMASKGFLYDPIWEGSHGTTRNSGMTDAQQQAYEDAEYGPQTGQPYDWTTAGCHGRSVHLTGQDNAN